MVCTILCLAIALGAGANDDRAVDEMNRLKGIWKLESMTVLGDDRWGKAQSLLSLGDKLNDRTGEFEIGSTMPGKMKIPFFPWSYYANPETKKIRIR